MKRDKEKIKFDVGITLIALVITIIVLLILAGVTIATLTGDNGLLSKTINAESETKISEEKEQITLASLALTNEPSITEEMWEKEIDKTKVVKIGEKTFAIKFEESKRVYWVEVGKEIILSEIDEEKNTDQSDEIKQDGTETYPYRINTIEDLVEFSNSVTSGTNYTGKYILLERELDFKSFNSYKNYATTEFGDINRNGKEEALITELTTESGFKPIGGSFNGIFDGNSHKIKNIYENRIGNAGLFSSINGATIKNIIIEGEITSIDSYAGGLVADQTNSSKIENCCNKAKIKGNIAGGLIGRSTNSVTIQNSSNLSDVTGQEQTGGIIGYAYGAHSTTDISKTYNSGNITSTNSYSGGIIGRGTGYSGGENILIKNCYNTGAIRSEKEYAAGIIGYIPVGNISNCYNAGNIYATNKKRGGIYGRITNTTVERSFYIKGSSDINGEGIEEKEELEMQSNEFVDQLNDGQESFVWRIDNSLNNGFPIFN